MLLFARNFLHSAARHSSRNPIEMIVFCLIIASFSYASLFRSLMESEFFNTESYQKVDSIKVISYPNSNEFTHIGKRDSSNIHAARIQLKQILINIQPDDEIISLDDDKRLITNDINSNHNSIDENDGNDEIIRQRLLDSVIRFKEIIENEIFVTDGKSKFYYNDDLCYKSNEDSSKCFDLNPNLSCSSSSTPHTNTSTSCEIENLNVTIFLNYALNTNSPYMNSLADAWEDKVANLNFESIVSFNGKRQLVHAEKGSFAWLAFVIGSLLMKFHELIQVCQFFFS